MKKRLIIIAYSIIPIIVLSLISYETGFGGPITKNQARSALLEFTKHTESPALKRHSVIIRSAKITTSNGITEIGHFQCDLNDLSWGIVLHYYNGVPCDWVEGRFYRDITSQWRARETKSWHAHHPRLGVSD